MSGTALTADSLNRCSEDNCIVHVCSMGRVPAVSQAGREKRWISKFTVLTTRYPLKHTFLEMIPPVPYSAAA